MKKLTYIPFIICGMLVTQSCFKDNKDLFDLSASERLEARMNQTQDSLTSSQYGWVMDYYPDQSKTAGGYTYVMDFNENSKVFVGYELAKPEERKESTFEMVADEGPVLIFNTYNEYIHYFAAPDRDNYQGKGGDFEFVIMDIQPGSIKTKGKKSKNFMMMYRLDMPADKYLTKRAETEAFITNRIFTLSDGNNKLAVTREIKSHTLTLEDKTQIPYVYTDKGVRLMSPIALGESSVQELVYTEDKNNLVNPSNSAVSLTGNFLSSVLDGAMNMGTNFHITEMSENIQNALNKFNSELKSQNLSVKSMSFTYNKEDYAICINLTGNVRAYFYIDALASNNNIHLSSYKKADINGNTLLENFPSVEELINLLCDKNYVATSLNGTLNFNSMKWESSSTRLLFSTSI